MTSSSNLVSFVNSMQVQSLTSTRLLLWMLRRTGPGQTLPVLCLALHLDRIGQIAHWALSLIIPTYLSIHPDCSTLAWIQVDFERQWRALCWSQGKWHTLLSPCPQIKSFSTEDRLVRRDLLLMNPCWLLPIISSPSAKKSYSKRTQPTIFHGTEVTLSYVLLPSEPATKALKLYLDLEQI